MVPTTSQQVPQARPDPRRPRPDLALLALAAWPLALLAIDPNRFFSNLYNDAWIYFGFFLNLPRHLRAFSEVQYFSSRLTVLIPGYLANLALPAVPAHLGLHLGLYYVTVGSLYLTLKRTGGRRAGFLAALLVGSNPFFLEAIGWDYVDGFGIAYASLATLLLAAGTRTRLWALAALGAGAAAAAMVVANPGYVLLVPPLIAAYAAGGPVFGDRRWAAVAALFAAGGVALVVGCASAYWWWTGTPRFLGPTFRWVAAAAGKPNPFRDPSLAWLPKATWLLVPGLGLACAAGVLVLGAWPGRPRPDRAPVAFAVQLLATATGFAFMDVRMQGIYFQSWSYASLLIPGATLVFGAALSGPLGRLGPTTFAAVATVGAAAQLATLALSVKDLLPRVPLPPLVAAAVPAALAVALLSRRAAGLGAWIPAFVLLGLAQAIARDGFEVKNSFPRAMWYQTAGMDAYDDRRLDLLRLIAEADRAVLALEPSGEARFWYRIAEPHGLVFKAITCTHCDTPRVVGVMFPRINPGAATNDRRPPPREMLVVVLTSSPDVDRVAELARASLRLQGRDAREVGRRRLSRAGIDLTMLFLRSRAAAD